MQAQAVETVDFRLTTFHDLVERVTVPAVEVDLAEVSRILGRPHAGSPEDDEATIEALLAAGAPSWIERAEGWVADGALGVRWPLPDGVGADRVACWIPEHEDPWLPDPDAEGAGPVFAVVSFDPTHYHAAELYFDGRLVAVVAEPEARQADTWTDRDEADFMAVVKHFAVRLAQVTDLPADNIMVVFDPGRDQAREVPLFE